MCMITNVPSSKDVPESIKVTGGQSVNFNVFFFFLPHVSYVSFPVC